MLEMGLLLKKRHQVHFVNLIIGTNVNNKTIGPNHEHSQINDLINITYCSSHIILNKKSLVIHFGCILHQHNAICHSDCILRCTTNHQKRDSDIDITFEL